jgi:HD-like signal output (HDOD) protein
VPAHDPGNLFRHRLAALEPLSGLAPEAFEELAQKLRPERVEAGRHLFLRGQRDRWSIYLLDGTLRLEGPEAAPQLITGGSEATRRPVGDEQPRRVTATAQTVVTIVRIDRNLLAVLQPPAAAEAYAVEELRDDDAAAENRLLAAIVRDHMADRLELPHLPDIAFKVRQATRDPHCDADHLARIVQTDPVITAKLIQAANSPLYGVQTPLHDCRAAILFLGMQTTRDLVTSFALRDLFQGEARTIQGRMRELWRHTALIAGVSHVLAGMTPGLSRDWAMLGGLLHDVGALPVLHYAGRQPDLVRTPADIDAAVLRLRGPVGAMVLRRWQFGDEMVGMLLSAEEWRRDTGRPADYVDLLIAAHLVIGGELLPGMPPREELPAWRKMARGTLDATAAERILAEARAEVADTLQLSG